MGPNYLTDSEDGRISRLKIGNLSKALNKSTKDPESGILDYRIILVKGNVKARHTHRTEPFDRVVVLTNEKNGDGDIESEISPEQYKHSRNS